jgi:hypothetical protein
MDRVKEQRTGVSRQSMGLDADALQSTTATAVAAMTSASQGKIEMIARVFAETGVRRLFQGILHLVTKYDNKPKMIRLNNQFTPIDPREWSHTFDVQINVGLGNGTKDEQLRSLFIILQKQEQIMQMMGPNNPLVNPLQYRNTLAKIAELSGFKNVNDFFGDPRQAPPQQPQQPQQDPQLALELQKLQAELEMDRQKMQMEFELKKQKMMADLQLRREELEFEKQLRTEKVLAGLETSTNLPRV